MAKLVKTKTTSPSAWVVNSNDRGRKSIKSGKVYLQDKEEFQIELFNPLQNCVLADIKLNGKSISKTGLVLNPGQRFYLDCFLDDRKKFVFSTYEVDDTDEVSNAIAKNGLLEVYFYKETVVNVKNWTDDFYKRREIIIEKYYPYNPYPWGNGIYYSNGFYGDTSGTVTLGNSTTSNYSMTNISSNTDSGAIFTNSVNTNTGINTGTVNSSLTSNVLNKTKSTTRSLNIDSSAGGSAPDSIETGRIEKGSKSKQQFESIDMEFEKYYIASSIVQLLPESRKPVETKEIKKISDSGENVISLISKLSELHNAGILTDEEFSLKKTELLSKI